MTHKSIRRFQIDGTLLSDAKIPSTRSEMIRVLVDDMRSKGYIPLFDVDPAFSTSYDEKEDKWSFLLTVHGVFVGRSKAWQYEGLADGRMISRRTPKDKSKQSSKP